MTQVATTVQLRNPRTIGRCPHGSESRLTAGGPVCAHNPPPEVQPLRPAGHGHGLDGPVCSERSRPQCPDQGDYRVRMCVRCGRITARIDTDGAAWCGGTLAGVQGKPVRHLAVVGA
ncbi:hypothetical protein [Dactylosporangium sp. CA-139066]|uniref:hypothetical protein n=1 Tax=Dactylosporangium sp. CA-139066 TaxID=3239930 RepID=UPI003D89D4B8